MSPAGIRGHSNDTGPRVESPGSRTKALSCFIDLDEGQTGGRRHFIRCEPVIPNHVLQPEPKLLIVARRARICRLGSVTGNATRQQRQCYCEPHGFVSGTTRAPVESRYSWPVGAVRTNSPM